MDAQKFSPTRPQMRPSKHALDESTRRSMVVLLNQRLADATDLYSQTKHAHWNVKGMDFYQLHKLFDELAETVEGHVDLIAERATALGGQANGTLRMAASSTSLPELGAELETGREFLEALTENYARHSKKLADGIEQADEAGDEGTADLLTQIVRDVDESLYFLESHLHPAKGK